MKSDPAETGESGSRLRIFGTIVAPEIEARAADAALAKYLEVLATELSLVA